MCDILDVTHSYSWLHHYRTALSFVVWGTNYSEIEAHIILYQVCVSVLAMTLLIYHWLSSVSGQIFSTFYSWLEILRAVFLTWISTYIVPAWFLDMSLEMLFLIFLSTWYFDMGYSRLDIIVLPWYSWHDVDLAISTWHSWLDLPMIFLTSRLWHDVCSWFSGLDNS